MRWKSICLCGIVVVVKILIVVVEDTNYKYVKDSYCCGGENDE